VPELLYSDTTPVGLNFATTRFGPMIPGIGLRFDAFGRGDPAGNTVMNVFAVWFTAVMLRTTAATPEAGTPPRPVIWTFVVKPAPSAPPPADTPSTVANPGRVSSSRAGDRAK
jgi:hypothetical protein